ncbi:hypothetical protein [Variovorax sp. PAMC26660]|uniref:hypothetical protein n=1 Tax=Variovorax sp. PAMC26660 TaxID=2762322 RepID=UPI00164E69D4|nr:hypothetical protein [Variovorax sp. PAMC26660]QNK66860.1 hypothetical protein H7F35_27375 [Variovorax sp. PAMC26660]
MATDHPLFIYRYMDRAAPRGDSPRFRVRIGAAFPDGDGSSAEVKRRLRAEAGIVVPTGQWGTLWNDFFTRSPMEEVLTAITITFNFLLRQSGPRPAAIYRASVERALAEEHMGFRIDEQGIIHYAVDEVFEGMRAATLAILNDPVLAVARSCYESAFQHLDRHPPDTKPAIRSMFEALEVIAKQLNPTARNLHANLCRVQLRDQYLAVSAGDGVEQRVWGAMFEGMAQWVQGMHEYRHGQVDNLAPPTEEFTVYVLSSGSAFLRLLAHLALRVGVQPAPAIP